MRGETAVRGGNVGCSGGNDNNQRKRIQGEARNVAMRILPTAGVSFSSIRSPTNALFASTEVTRYDRCGRCNTNSLSCRDAPFAQTSNQQHRVPDAPACRCHAPQSPTYFQEIPVYAPHCPRVNMYQASICGVGI